VVWCDFFGNAPQTISLFHHNANLFTLDRVAGFAFIDGKERNDKY
jgi:hypothetical protein